MSLLRFKQPNSNSKSALTIGLSNCGFEVTVIKQKKVSLGKDVKKPSLDYQLVLTNMTFSYGVHYWEIICPISCQDIYLGAYNPLSKKEVMETFYNTTPRSIFICLDLIKGQIRFWLNEHKNTQKVLNLEHSPGQ
mmetsp:Transcript_13543/g.21115  ORF Transcript_13543/g.21115 Transcript_13543/m.21115 type:complete len:135 (-) Transcript_13543:17393-17797(-)